MQKKIEIKEDYIDYKSTVGWNPRALLICVTGCAIVFVITFITLSL